MRVFRTGIHKQFLEHGVAKFIFWQHAFDGDLNEALWSAGTNFCGCEFFQTAWVTGVVLIDLYILLITGKSDFTCVDHDHIVTGVHVWGEFRAVFASENRGDLGAHAAHYLVFSIYHKPAPVDLFVFY